MPGYIDVDAAIAEAKRLLSQHKEAQEKVAIVRTDLRNAVSLGQANAEQRKYITETFPVRTRKSKKTGQAVAA